LRPGITSWTDEVDLLPKGDEMQVLYELAPSPVPVAAQADDPVEPADDAKGDD
jgi:hypothetical protein